MTLKNANKARIEGTTPAREIMAPPLGIIKSMAIGQTGYAVPWALRIDPRDGRVYLDTGYTINDEAGGTVELPIKRLAVDDWEVDLGINTEIHTYAQDEPDPDEVCVGTLGTELNPKLAKELK